MFLLFTTFSCIKEQSPTNSQDIPSMENDEVETNEIARPKSHARIAAEPDFWDPNYRSYKVINIYAEVDYTLSQRWGVGAKDSVAKAIAVASKISERETGIKLVLQKSKIWTTVDTWYTYTNPNLILNEWGGAVYSEPTQFKMFFSGKNLGGIAYIFRGEVTQAKFCVVSTLDTKVGDDKNYTFLIYCILHELYHNLGVSHTQNCCAWKDKNGVALGRLDSCYQSENSCGANSTLCSSTTKSMDGGINSYCHLYGRLKYTVKAPVLAVLHRALYYATDVPSYTPTTTPCVTTYGTWSTCSNGLQTRTYTQTGTCTIPPTDSTRRTCSVTVVPVSAQVTYQSGSRWRVRFNVPINATTYPTYSINVCRYGNTCGALQACGSRGTYTITATEKTNGLIDRELNPQPLPPSNGTWCYKSSITASGVTYWTPSFTVIK